MDSSMKVACENTTCPAAMFIFIDNFAYFVQCMNSVNTGTNEIPPYKY
jgi:hypothetical protein